MALGPRPAGVPSALTGRYFEPAAMVAATLLAALAAVVAGTAWLRAPTVLADVVIVLGTAVVLWRRPYVALLALLCVRAAVPNFELPSIALAVGGGLALVLNRASLPPKRAVLPFVAFLALALVTVPLIPSERVLDVDKWLVVPVADLPYFPRGLLGVREWLRLASVLVVFCLAFSVSRQPHDVDVIVTAVLVSAVVAVAIGLWQWTHGETYSRQGFDGVAGPFSHPSSFGHYLVVVLGLGFVAMARALPGPARAAVAAVVAGAGACLFLTYSRAAWLGLILVVLTLGLLANRHLLVVLAVAVPIGFVIVPGAATKVEQRFADLSTSSGGYAANSWGWRVSNWNRMLPYGFEQPLRGQGFGSYFDVSVREYGSVTDTAGQKADDDQPAPTTKDNVLGVNAHNDYLKAFVEMGFVGAVLWVGVFVGLASALWRARRAPPVRSYATALFGVTLAFIGIGAADNVRDNPVTLVYLAAVAGAVLGAARGHAADEGSRA